MKFDINPSSHIPPYKRIDLAPVRRPTEPADPIDLLALSMHRTKAEALWKITKQVAEGTNAPSIAPVEHVQEVDSSGWEVAFKMATDRAVEVAIRNGAKVHPRVKRIKSDAGSVT